MKLTHILSLTVAILLASCSGGSSKMDNKEFKIEYEKFTLDNDTKYSSFNFSHSNCSINTEQQNITVWHDTKAPEGKEYSQENDTDFM